MTKQARLDEQSESAPATDAKKQVYEEDTHV